MSRDGGLFNGLFVYFHNIGVLVSKKLDILDRMPSV